MILEEDKYRAQVFKIAGFALMTPAAKLFLEFLDFSLADINIKFIGYALVCFGLLLLGIMMLQWGYEFSIEE